MAKVLLEVDDVLGDHDRVLDVVLHPFKALDTLLTSVPEKINQDLSLKKIKKNLKTKKNNQVPAAPECVTDAHSLAHVHGSVHEVVVDNGVLS